MPFLRKKSQNHITSPKNGHSTTLNASRIIIRLLTDVVAKRKWNHPGIWLEFDFTICILIIMLVPKNSHDVISRDLTTRTYNDQKLSENVRYL